MQRRLPPLSKGLEIIGVLGTFAVAVGVVLGFFGETQPLFDTIGQFRAHASAALVLLGLGLVLGRYRAAGISCLVTAAFGLYTVVPFMTPFAATPAVALPEGMARYTLLQMNLRFDAPDMPRTVRLIETLSPDVVTVQEMTGEWDQTFQTIARTYPYQYYCAPPEHAGDVAILSRRPFVDGAPVLCDVWGGFTARTIDFDGVDVIIGSQHLRWPWPGRQWRQIKSLRPALEELDGARLIAGDFNSAPWSASIARYAAASETRVVGGIGPTWFANILPSAFAKAIGLPIDNVLASREVTVVSALRTDATSSDHLPVLVTFALPFARPAAPKVQSVSR